MCIYLCRPALFHVKLSHVGFTRVKFFCVLVCKGSLQRVKSLSLQGLNHVIYRIYKSQLLADFRGRFASLLSYQFRQFKPVVALSVLHTASCFDTRSACAYEELTRVLSQQDLKRLDLYSRNMADHHLITDLLPTCALLCER